MNVNLRPFDELVAKLREHGFSEGADEIAMLMSSAWTTSSEFIEANRGTHKITLMCRIYRVTRAGYYAWRSPAESG